MNFHKIKISNFMAIGYAEIDLQNQGFVAIHGINNTDPNTANCGTGKSSIANALHWALCGTTVKGGTDVKNQYTDGECAVAVEFEKGDKEYQLIRVKGKSLQIVENGQDISGKGIRDTQALIEQIFPEFTPEFIGATIIFGQKMPNAFTANSASKRKEILEKLTKSDFQIEEIKDKLTRKKDENAKALRVAEDESLTTGTILRELGLRKQENIQAKNALTLPADIAQQTERLKGDKATYEGQFVIAKESESQAQSELDRLQKEGTELGDKIRIHEKTQAELKEKDLAEAQQNKDAVVSAARVKSEQSLKEIRENLTQMKARQGELDVAVSTVKGKMQLAEGNKMTAERELRKAEEELVRIEKSTVCPTCGKPWGDDEHKVDLEPFHKRITDGRDTLVNLMSELQTTKDDLSKAETNLVNFKKNTAEYEQQVRKAEFEHSKEIAKTESEEQNKIAMIKARWDNDTTAADMMQRLSELRNRYSIQRDLLSRTKATKEQLENAIKDIAKKIEENERRVREYAVKVEELTERINKQCEKEQELIKESDEIGKRIESCKTRADQLNKLYNFATKKFRTILLEDTISIFENKAKAIAQKYFGVDITFKQDGANIEITYQGKQFENLSGGEECAAVLVIQTALRELLADLTGEESNLLFVDEVTDGADLLMSEKIMGMVGEYNTESVFIISHHDELNLPTDKALVVEKNNNIAEVRWE